MNRNRKSARVVLLISSMCLSLLIYPHAFSQSLDELRRLDELDAACLKAREAKLRLVQQQKVEECVNAPQDARAAAKSRAECERYWGDYGWTTGAAREGRRNYLFAELPECVRAFEARQR